MIRNRYRFEVRQRDRLLVVRLFGEIDHHSAVTLREELDELIADPKKFFWEKGMAKK